MLMETTRKCFTKIITNRMSTLCKERNILRGPNFAGLPGESTLEPIQLLNNICEEAREKKKELWILLQDTAKAFDTVNLEMLERALSRIRAPKKAIKLIIYLFKEREVKVIHVPEIKNRNPETISGFGARNPNQTPNCRSLFLRRISQQPVIQI
jgi:hypothetical protein